MTSFASYRQQGTTYFVSEREARSSAMRCRACNARVLFIRTAAGKNMPLDVDSGEVADNGELRCVSHFATCTQSSRTRDEKRPKSKTACPVTGCTGTVRQSELLCSACWREVPKRLRDEVLRAWDVAKHGPREAWKSYESAARAALSSANAARAAGKVRQVDAFDSNEIDPG